MCVRVDGSVYTINVNMLYNKFFNGFAFTVENSKDEFKNCYNIGFLINSKCTEIRGKKLPNLIHARKLISEV